MEFAKEKRSDLKKGCMRVGLRDSVDHLKVQGQEVGGIGSIDGWRRKIYCKCGF